MKRRFLIIVIPLASMLLAQTPGAPVNPPNNSAPVRQQTASPTNMTIPEGVRRPDIITEASYPRDLSIGSLGPGEAPIEVYRFAQRVLTEVLRANESSPLIAHLPKVYREELLKEAASVTPRKFRLGGGREEVDGSTSFLFRFIGREKECAGSIFLRQDEKSAWKAEDIIVEKVRDISAAKENDHPYEWSQYDRFY